VSEFGFQTGGFIPRTPQDIELDYQQAGSGVFEEINFGPGDPLYQLAKVFKLREYQMELFIKAITSGLSVQLAYDDALEKIGEGFGVFKKGPEKAGGYVHLTFEPPATGATYDLEGITYSTKTNINFERAESGAKIFNRYMTLTRGVGNTDSLRSPFVHVSGIGYITSQPLGAGTEYNPDWNYTYQYFDWTANTGAATTGMTYYVEVVNEMKVKDDVSAQLEGIGSNVGANTVVKWSNNTRIPANTVVNNPYSITGGASWEDNEFYRDRILRAPKRSFTLTQIRKLAEEINGVRSAYVYQAKGLDKTSVSGDWNITTPDYGSGVQITGIYSGAHDVVSGALWSQRWTPTQGIISLKECIIRGKRIGFPPPMVVGFRDVNDAGYSASGIFDTFNVKPPASTIQNMNVDFTYLDLDFTKTYVFEFWCRDKTGAVGSSYWDENYWVLITGSMSGNLGDTDDYTGMLYDPAGDSHESNILFKTQYGAAAFKVDLAIKDGYNFNELSNTLDDKLDWVDGGGFAPIGVDYSINEATAITIYLTATVYIIKESLSSFTVISSRIESDIERYVEKLKPGENVVYSEIYYRIMKDPETWRVDELEIFELGGTHLEDEDIFIAEGEVAVFGGSTFNRG